MQSLESHAGPVVFYVTQLISVGTRCLVSTEEALVIKVRLRLD
jgi:hypothetical protein